MRADNEGEENIDREKTALNCSPASQSNKISCLIQYSPMEILTVFLRKTDNKDEVDRYDCSLRSYIYSFQTLKM